MSGGFAEITPERCTVLADEAMPVAEVSRAPGETRLQAAEAEYEAADKMDVAARWTLPWPGCSPPAPWWPLPARP